MPGGSCRNVPTASTTTGIHVASRLTFAQADSAMGRARRAGGRVADARHDGDINAKLDGVTDCKTEASV